MSGSSGTPVSDVGSGPSFRGYGQPANWTNPPVTGRDLMVHTDTLRSVANQLGAMASELEKSLGDWQSAATSAASALGGWTAATSLAAVVDNAYRGVSQFTSELRQAHNDTQTRLNISADRYDSTEQQLMSVASRANDPTATIVGSGGNNTAVDPTPSQARLMVIEDHQPGGRQENWQQSLPITEDSSFEAGSTAGLSYQEVQSLLDATDPDAVTNAGTAYLTLYNQLTDISGKLSGQGARLAADWGGSTAVTAVSQVQQLWQTASDMQANTFSAGTSLQWYGGVLASFKSGMPNQTSPTSKGGKSPTQAAITTASNASNQAAQEHLAQLNQHIGTTYSNMPPSVNKNLPSALSNTGSYSPAGGATGGGAGGASPAVTGGSGTTPGVTGAVPGGTAPAGTIPGGTLPGGTSPGGVGTLPPTKLAGVGPGGVTGTAPTGPTGPTGPSPVGVGTAPSPGGPGGGLGALPPPVGTGTSGSGGDPGDGGDPGPVGIGTAGNGGDPGLAGGEP
ncbi:MAG: hypothetical protein ACRDNF_03475, partial [Streptosporangiaceae bacterium]